MTVFVDTSALYAAADQEDAEHRRSVAAWSDLLLRSVTLLTTNYVLLETSALLQSRLGHSALRAFHQDVYPLLSVDWISLERHRAGVEAVLTAARRKLSIVDCVSFHTMRSQSVQTAFAFDPHFREQGFHLIP